MNSQYEKLYVSVDAHYPSEGVMKPARIFWPDGQVFEIQDCSKPEKAASLKVGGAGLRYRVQIPFGDATYERDLYFVDNRWFVEKKIR